MSLWRLLAIVRKEFRHVARDARLSFLVIAAPAFLLVTLSYVFSFKVDRVDVAVRDLDATHLSRSFLAALAADGDFRIVGAVEGDAEADDLLERGAADLVLLIPHGFADDLLGGGPAELGCVVDGADALTASQVVGILESRIDAFAARFAVEELQLRPGTAGGLAVSSQARYNETLEPLDSLVPGMMAMVLCMPALAMALSLAREKETGSFEGLVATPVRGIELLVGKLLAFGTGGLVSSALAWCVATLWFHVPFRGSILVFFLFTAGYLFASLGFSLVVAGAVRNQQTAMFVILMFFFVPSFFMAGLLTPVADEPVARIASAVLPATHFITLCRGLFLKGQGLAALWRPVAALLSMGSVCLAGGLALFRKRIA